MQKVLKILRWVLTGATVGMVLLLCWQCFDIYMVGNSSENLSGGVYLTPVYTAQGVAERLSALTPLFVIYAILAVATIFINLVWGTAPRNKVKIRPCPPRAANGKGLAAARIAVFFLGALFIVLGALNGGARDVLIKAINICTECIGLG